MKLIVGLGNPGEKYQNSRHNLGFEVVEKFIAHRLPATDYSKNIWQKADKLKALVYRLETEDVLIIKPQTYMNNSGLAVKASLTAYRLPLTDLIVIHDDLDLNLGKIKIRQGGSGAGHHGVESIIKALGNDKFIRVKLGIATPALQSSERGGQSVDVDHFVLKKFMPSERSRVRRMIKEAVEATELLLKEGLEKAQNKYN